MKLIFMTPRLSYTGAPKIMAWVANQMVKKGHDVTIITMYKSECGQILDSKVKYESLNCVQNSNWLYRNTLGIFKVLIKYRKKIKEYKPEVILSFLDSVSYFYIFLNKLFWHDKILVSERVDPYSRKGWRAKICFYITGISDYIVFQTPQAQKFFKEKFLNKSCVIQNPVVLNDAIKKVIDKRNDKNYKHNNDFYKISNVGRLSLIQKRQDVLLNAIKELKNKKLNFKLYIYGSGEDEAKIRKIINENKLQEDVILMGQQNNIPEKISDSTCFVLTSDFEGIPNALIEAMSIGLPCVSTDCSPGGAKLLIENEVNGFLVDKGDYKNIAQKIEWIIKHPKQSKTIGKNAMTITEKFSEEKISNLWEKAFIKTNKK